MLTSISCYNVAMFVLCVKLSMPSQNEQYSPAASASSGELIFTVFIILQYLISI